MMMMRMMMTWSWWWWWTHTLSEVSSLPPALTVTLLLFCLLSLCCSKNANNSESEVVLHDLEVAAMADVILQGWGSVNNIAWLWHHVFDWRKQYYDYFDDCSNTFWLVLYLVKMPSSTLFLHQVQTEYFICTQYIVFLPVQFSFCRVSVIR